MISLQASNNGYRITALFIILIIIGVQWVFYTSYTSQFPTFENATPVIHIHGATDDLAVALGAAADANLDILEAAIQDGVKKTSN